MLYEKYHDKGLELIAFPANQARGRPPSQMASPRGLGFLFRSLSLECRRVSPSPYTPAALTISPSDRVAVRHPAPSRLRFCRRSSEAKPPARATCAHLFLSAFLPPPTASRAQRAAHSPPFPPNIFFFLHRVHPPKTHPAPHHTSTHILTNHFSIRRSAPTPSASSGSSFRSSTRSPSRTSPRRSGTARARSRHRTSSSRRRFRARFRGTVRHPPHGVLQHLHLPVHAKHASTPKLSHACLT